MTLVTTVTPLQVALDVGVFKYVLMRLTEPESGRSKLMVWGDNRAGRFGESDEKGRIGFGEGLNDPATLDPRPFSMDDSAPLVPLQSRLFCNA